MGYHHAAFNISKIKQHGQTGFILEILYECKVTKDKMYPMVDCASTKQKHVCHFRTGQKSWLVLMLMIAATI